MGKIVNFSDKNKYQNELKEIIYLLDDFNDTVRHKMFVLATLDKWKDWADNQPVGASIELTEEMMRNTGDKNVNALFELEEKIAITKTLLTKG